MAEGSVSSLPGKQCQWGEGSGRGLMLLMWQWWVLGEITYTVLVAREEAHVVGGGKGFTQQYRGMVCVVVVAAGEVRGLYCLCSSGEELPVQ